MYVRMYNSLIDIKATVICYYNLTHVHVCRVKRGVSGCERCFRTVLSTVIQVLNSAGVLCADHQ